MALIWRGRSKRREARRRARLKSIKANEKFRQRATEFSATGKGVNPYSLTKEYNFKDEADRARRESLYNVASQSGGQLNISDYGSNAAAVRKGTATTTQTGKFISNRERNKTKRRKLTGVFHGV